MATSQILITNLKTPPLSLDLQFGEITVRALLALNASVDVTQYASWEQVNANTTLLALRDATQAGGATISITQVPGADDLPGPLPGDPILADDLAITPSTGFGTLVSIRGTFAAGGGGAADDVTVTADAPYRFRICDSQVEVAVTPGASTMTLRSAVAGGGSALSDALNTGTTGRKRDAGGVLTWPTVGVGGGVYWRRSDNGVGGEYLILAEKY